METKDVNDSTQPTPTPAAIEAEAQTTAPVPAEPNGEAPAETPKKEKARYPWLAWLAVLLTIGAWLVLVWVNGPAAVAVGLAAIACAITSMALNRGPLHRLSTTALVAAMVLELVVGAFLIILRMV